MIFGCDDGEGVTGLRRVTRAIKEGEGEEEEGEKEKKKVCHVCDRRLEDGGKWKLGQYSGKLETAKLLA